MNAPLCMSRVVEYPITVTANPPPVFEKLTEVMTGAEGAIVTVSVGAGLGVTSVPAALSDAVMVMVPATVPVTNIGAFGGGPAVPAGIVNVAVEESPLVEDTKPTSVGAPPAADVKLAVRWTERFKAYALLKSTLTDCWVAGVPLMVPIVTAGTAGTLTVSVSVAVAVCPFASVRVTTTLAGPPADGTPVMAPVDELSCKPAGNPLAAQV